LAAIGIGGGIIAAGWEHLRSMVSYLRNLVVVTASLDCGHEDFVFRFCKKIKDGRNYFRLGNKDIYFGYWSNKDGSSIQSVICEKDVFGSVIWFFKWYCPVLVDVKDTQKISVTYVRWLFPLSKFLVSCLGVDLKKNESNRWYITHCWGREDNFDSSGLKTTDAKASETCCDASGWHLGFRSHYYGLNNVISCKDYEKLGFSEKNNMSLSGHYETDSEKKLYKDIEFWLNSQDWYEKTGIQWKRGALLYGEPGTGKTSMVHNISRRLDIPVKVFHLEGFDNKLFQESWHGVCDGAICLIEDFDAVFNGREFLGKTQTRIGMTFDSFLNTIDGVDHRGSIFMIITTNHPEKLDKALVDYKSDDNIILRPGRIDHVIKCERVGREGVEFLANNILYDWNEEDRSAFIKSIDHLFPVTAAQAQELCMSVAIDHRWNRRT